MTVSEEALESIRKHAVHIDWDLAFKGRSKGNRHLHRVSRIAIHLAERSKARIDICTAGGWLHDIGLVEGNRHHCFTGAQIAQSYLAELGIDPREIEQIVHCIEAHDGEVPARSLEAKVVHDADTMDKMGIFGFIRHVWKISLIDSLSTDEMLNSVPEHIAERRSKLYLHISREIVRGLDNRLSAFLRDRAVAGEVVELISKKAFQGIPSEGIAEELIKNSRLGKEFLESIKSQMTLAYLSDPVN